MKSKPYFIITGLTLIISIGLYVISLTQECYCVTGSRGNHWLGIYCGFRGHWWYYEYGQVNVVCQPDDMGGMGAYQ